MSEYDPQNPYAPSPTKPASAPDPSSPAPALLEPSAPLDLASVPPAPREPTARAREILFGTSGQIGVFAVGFVFFAVGMIFVYGFARNLPSDFALTMFGRAARGTIISDDVDTKMTLNGRHPTVVSFRYDVDGTTYESTSGGVGLHSALKKEGGAVDVEALVFAPSVARIKGTTRNEAGYSPVFVFIFPIAGLAIPIGSMIARSRRKKAFRFGRATIGQIFSKYGGNSATRKQSITVVWKFSDDRGSAFRGSFSHPNPMMLADFEKNTPVIVLFDEKNPKINTLYLT